VVVVVVDVVVVVVTHPPIGVWTQPLAGSQESVVQALPSSQLSGSWTHPTPESQESVVHRSPSSQSTRVHTHACTAASQVSVEHGSLSRQSASEIQPTNMPQPGLPSPHAAARQISTQRFVWLSHPELKHVGSADAGKGQSSAVDRHWPVAGSHELTAQLPPEHRVRVPARVSQAPL
jgi:hypothetical protein